jgi:hypothetical protein
MILWETIRDNGMSPAEEQPRHGRAAPPGLGLFTRDRQQVAVPDKGPAPGGGAPWRGIAQQSTTGRRGRAGTCRRRRRQMSAH